MRVHKLQLENPLWIYNQPNINFNWAPYFTPVIINILIIGLLYVPYAYTDQYQCHWVRIIMICAPIVKMVIRYVCMLCRIVDMHTKNNTMVFIFICRSLES